MTIAIKRALALVGFAILTLAAYAQSACRFYDAERLSNSMISCIVQDSYGYIWIGTEHGLNRFDGYNFTTYLDIPGDSTSLASPNITMLRVDKRGRLWVGTGRGLCRYDYATGAFHRHLCRDGQQPRVSCMAQLPDGRLYFGTAGYFGYTLEADGTLRQDKLLNGPHTPTGYYSRMITDSQGRLWRTAASGAVAMRDMRHGGKVADFTTAKGPLYDIVEQDGHIYVVSLFGIDEYKGGRLVDADLDLSALVGERPMIGTAYVDADGNLLLGTRSRGLYRIAKGSRKAVPVRGIAGDIDLATASIDAIAGDREHNIWIGCKRRGIVMVAAKRPPFSAFSFSNQRIDIGTSVSSIAASGDADARIYMVVQNKGVCSIATNGRPTPLRTDPPAAQTIHRDWQGRYWLGTGNSLYLYDPATGRADRRATIECDRVNAIATDRRGNVFFSAMGRGFCMLDAAGRMTNYNADDAEAKDALCNNWVLGMACDSRGLLWLATSSGAACFDPQRRTFRRFGWKAQIEGHICFSIAEDKGGNILIGTDHGLYLCDPKKGRTGPDSRMKELQDKMVNSIILDRAGDIWCGTSDGIWQWKRRDRRTAGYVRGGGLVTKEYVIGTVASDAGGRLYFGTADGFVCFRPDDIHPLGREVAPFCLTAFIIAGHPANAATLSGNAKVMDGYVGDCRHFTVDYTDNSFRLEFSQLQYTNPQNIVLEYRVNGTGEWLRNSEGDTQIAFNHMQSGTYTLEVRALEGTRYSALSTYSITVLAPWYATALAYSIYVILFIAFIVYMVYAYDRDRRKQFDEYKMKFLINATHDIRSPLTLIKSPLANLRKRIAVLAEGEQKAGFTDDIDTIERNAGRVLGLVNQILDLRKMDKDQMHLHCRETDLVDMAAGTVKMYDYNARQRGIALSFEHTMESMSVWLDRTQFDKVLSNLLSNAFKYTPDGGVITVRLSRTEGERPQAVIEVMDTGSGLASGAAQHIFERFYQAPGQMHVKTEGTGIGLNLCKMIMDLHHGTIAAANRTDCQGSIFTVSLPLGKAHLLPEEIDRTVEPAVRQHKTAAKTGRRVLIVDDDHEIADYICRELGEYYKFATAPNGKEGLREALTAQPQYDAIVSDVMMPEMDGFSMLRMIKTNPNVAHVPVIMLTSKADVGNRLEGLDRGADAFLAKPFDMDELHATIDNVVEKTVRLRGRFSGAQQQADKVEVQEVKGNDEQLMERIMKSVNKHLGDSDFTVDMLTEEVGISRAQLHRKMKDMTGLSTSEFVRNIRLEQAARLLKEQKVNITQVAYTVGFSNLAHFSTVFRKHFGMTPTEYGTANGETV